MKKTIKEHIKHSGMKSKWVAEKIGVCVMTVSNWNRGFTFPQHDDLVRLARLLKVKIKDIKRVDNGKSI